MEESDDSSGEWLTTYADFITLMMCFFVALYSLTSGVEKDEFQEFISAFRNDEGVLRNEMIVKQKTTSIKEQRLKNWRKFRKVIRKNNWQEEVKFEVLPSGVKITLGESITFETYSAMLAPVAKKILRVAAHSIDKYAKEPLKIVQVYGHTDNRPILSKAGKFANNWELGAARAISVVRFLIKKSATAPSYFEAITFGPYRPIASNATRKGRRKNRRIEIFVKYVIQDSAAAKKGAAPPSSLNSKSMNYE